jgi:formylglycine-generating enzyme required for sulfatase activity
MIKAATFAIAFLLTAGLTSSFSGPIHQAVRARDLVTLESLLNPASERDLAETIKGGVTALHLAAATDLHAGVKLLVERGAPVNSKTTTGFTPLHWAASRDSADSVSLLLANGATVNAKAQSGITPLHWAASKNAAAAVRLLIEAGADLTATTDRGYTPLHLAVKQDPYSETAVLLAKARVDAEADAGFLMVEELPETEPVEEETAEVSSDELPESSEQDSASLLPGTFLSVALGLGSSLSFVWVEPLSLWIGKYEITNRQYRHFDRKHSSRAFEGLALDGSEQPAVYVSWEDASDYCVWLNENFASRIPPDSEFRLPTAEEWEFIAACGDARKYPWGDDWPPLYGNHSDATARKHLSQWRGIRGYEDGYAVTCQVDHSGMNEWGIYGLAGNVWEWCQDWMNEDKRSFKLRKGGSWDFDEKDSLKIRAHGIDRPDAKYDTIGFRVVVAQKPAPADQTVLEE